MDASRHPAVVEYAVHEMFKGKVPAVAARATVKKLSGGTNLFIGQDVQIDATVLESALWQRILDVASKGSIEGALLHFRLIPLTWSGAPDYAKVQEKKAKLIAEAERRRDKGEQHMGSADRQTMHDFVRKHGVTMKAVRVDYNPHMEEDGRYPMDHWRCILHCDGKRATITFSMGSGHNGREPTAADVINAMASDASSAKNSSDWEDFAREMGMETHEEDPDTGRLKPNKKAKRTYEACLREYEQLVNLFGDDGANEVMYETEGL